MKKTFGLAIPATINYINDLENLLENISHQSEKPDEISISISEIDNYYPEKNYGLNLIITCHKDKKNGATNRNIAAQKLNTDLISFFDCDDLMHPKRIEIIKKSFDENNINGLVHDFDISKDVDFKNQEFSFENFKKQEFQNYNLFLDIINTISSKHLFPVDENSQFSYHNAHLTVLREIFEKYKYDETHHFPDSLYNRTLVQNGIKISFLKHKLSYYNL